MAIEIERKFLVKDDSWHDAADAGTHYRQGYFSAPGRASIRVRIEGNQANINIKSAELGVRRAEYEYPIPLADAQEMLDSLCEHPQVEKTRYHVRQAGHTWEIDVFEGENAGLVVAEIELEDEHAVFDRPAWLGEEVSDDPRYYNVSLARHPFTRW